LRQPVAVQLGYRSRETVEVPVERLQTAIARRERLEHATRGIGSRLDR
jgi:hypothetical protein